MFRHRQTHEQHGRQRLRHAEPTTPSKEHDLSLTAPQPASSPAIWEQQGYGDNNEFVTSARYAELKTRLRDKLNREQAVVEVSSQNPLPRVQRRVALQEHPLFEVYLRWLEEHGGVLLLRLLRQGNQALLDHICDIVNWGLAEYAKLIVSGPMTLDIAMEFTTRLVVPDDGESPVPATEAQELDALLVAFRSWLPESQPRYPCPP